MNENTITNDVEIEIYVDEATSDQAAPCDVCRW
ncbi:hypothetical protein ABIA35_008251 [Catenulispora sp. MAP12-49]|jgi:hypothetical protein